MRNLRPWKGFGEHQSQPAVARMSPSPEQQQAVALYKIVNSDGWQVLREMANSLCQQSEASIPNKLDNLIGYFSYSVMRDVLEQLLDTAEKIAAKAPQEYLG